MVAESVRTAQGVAESVAHTLDALRTECADLYLVHSSITSFDDASGSGGANLRITLKRIFLNGL